MPEQPRAPVRLLVTGAGGFVGRHVCAAVESGLFGDVFYLPARDGFDIRDPRDAEQLIVESRPDLVLHLAAQSFIPRSFENPRETLDINVMGTLNLLQALEQSAFAGRLLYVSSGDVYGLVPDEALPVDEGRLPEPRSPYAVSKLAAEQLCLQWHRTRGLDAVVARPFNHIGPGQSPDFVVPAFARQIVAIARGETDPLVSVGDIDVSRDFTDVRDVVAAYAAILRHGRAGATYVVGSGVERRLRELLGTMCELAGIAPEIRVDPARLRPAEQRRMVADASALTRETGWTPRIPIQQTLKDILESARKPNE